MGLNKEMGIKPFWTTLVETESKICIKESVGMRQIIDRLSLQGAESQGDVISSETLRHVVYAKKGAQVEKSGTDHVTVILFEHDPYSGYVRPKRKFIDSSGNDYANPNNEEKKIDPQKDSASSKIEFPVILFDSPASKKLAIKSGLYQVGVKEPEDFVSSQPFIKRREKKLFRHPNGLILEVAGDTIITKPKTLQRIETEITPPFFPNSEYIKQLESDTEQLRQILKAEGLTIYNGKSNSTVMLEYLTRNRDINNNSINTILKRAKQETEKQNKKNQKIPRAA